MEYLLTEYARDCNKSWGHNDENSWPLIYGVCDLQFQQRAVITERCHENSQEAATNSSCESGKSSLLGFWTQFQCACVRVCVCVCVCVCGGSLTPVSDSPDTNCASYNSTPFWHYLTRGRTRFHKLRVQLDKTALCPQFRYQPQAQLTTCASGWPAVDSIRKM